MPCFFFSGVAKGGPGPSKSLLCPATDIERSRYSNRTVIYSNKAVSRPSSTLPTYWFWLCHCSFAFSKSRDIALDSSDNLSSVTIYDQIAVEVGWNSKISYITYLNVYNVHIALCLLYTLMKTRYIAILMYACFKIKLRLLCYNSWSFYGA